MKLATAGYIGPDEDLRTAPGRLRMDVAFGHVVFVMMILSISVPGARLLNYGLPFLALLIIIANRSVNLAELARPYLLIVAAGILLFPLGNLEGARDIYLIATGLSAAVVGYRRLPSWNTIFIAAVLGLALNAAISGLGSGAGRDLRNFRLDFATSQSTLESDFSYIFGLLAVWAAHTRRWKQFALAMAMSILTLKRIAFLGILLCVAVQFLPSGWTARVLRPLPMIVINGLLLFTILMYGTGKLDALIYEISGQSGNQFGMGRQELYRFILVDFFREPWKFFFLGIGPGDAYHVMKGGAVWASKENLHSDLLKIFYEYGAVVLTAFIGLLYSYRKKGVLSIALFTNALLLTDNNLIYPYYIYFATLIATHIAMADSQGGISSTPEKTDGA